MHQHSFSGQLTFNIWQALFSSYSFWHAVLQTLQTGIGTAALSVITALFFAYTTYERKSYYAYLIPFLPLAISPLAMGAGWLRMHHTTGIHTLIIVQTSLAWSFALTQIESSLQKIPRAVIDSALLLSQSRRDAFFRILFPMCRSGIISAFCSVFAISAGDTTLPLLLHIPQFENIALLLFRFAGSYRFAESSATAIFLLLLTSTLFFVQERFQKNCGITAVYKNYTGPMHNNQTSYTRHTGE